MDVLAAHFEGREPMRPGFSGANDKLYAPSFFRISALVRCRCDKEGRLMIVLFSLLGILSDLDSLNRD
jgi:hypothetical protein